MSRAVQLVLLSAVILTCLQTGAGQHVISDSDVERISTAVLQQLLPYINRIEANLRRDLTNLINEKVTSLRESVREDLMDYKNQTASDLQSLQSNTQQLCAKMDTLDLKMVSVNVSMREELRAMKSQLEEPIASELAGLQRKMSDLHTSLQSNTTKQLMQFSTKMDTVKSNLVSVNSALEQTILSNLTEQLQKTHNYRDLCPVPPLSTFLPVTPNPKHPTTSLPPSPTTQTPYPIPSPTSSSLFSCGGTGGWRRVVYLNFTDPNTPCPSGWQLTSYSKRTCARGFFGYRTCDSVTFPVSGGDYTRVCGRIIAYQYGSTGAFWSYDSGTSTTIDGVYVDGVSLTHGSPRQHIWTLAAGATELLNHNPQNIFCPCDTPANITIPPFVGGDYFCESGHNSWPFQTFYPDDPLWDGDGCTANSTCCSFNNPPYFTKQLPSPTTDDIEARLCHFYANNDIPIEFIELYVQ